MSEPRRSSLPPVLILVVIAFGLVFFVAERVLGPFEPVEPTPTEEPADPAPRAEPELDLPPDPEREAVVPTEAAEGGPSDAAPRPAEEPEPAFRDLTVLLTGLDPAHAEGLLMLAVAEELEGEELASIRPLEPVGEPLVFEDLPADELLLLLLHHEDWSSSRDPIASLAVDLRAVDAAVELVVPELFDLEVHAPGLEAGTNLAMDLTAGLGWRSFGKHVAEVDLEGNARFEALPAGAYTLHSSGKQLELELPSAPVVFE